MYRIILRVLVQLKIKNTNPVLEILVKKINKTAADRWGLLKYYDSYPT